jgi:hypothetical protein
MVFLQILTVRMGYKVADQGVTKRCRLSWLTNSALAYEPKCRVREELQAQPMSTVVYRSPNKLWRYNSIFNLCGRHFSAWIYRPSFGFVSGGSAKTGSINSGTVLSMTKSVTGGPLETGCMCKCQRYLFTSCHCFMSLITWVLHWHT